MPILPMNPIFSKGTERASSRVVWTLVVMEQYGFQLKRSTGTNLLQFTNHVAKPLNDRKGVHTVYTDFSKVFDSVDHSVFLNKARVRRSINCFVLVAIVPKCYVIYNLLESFCLDSFLSYLPGYPRLHSRQIPSFILHK